MSFTPLSFFQKIALRIFSKIYLLKLRFRRFITSGSRPTYVKSYAGPSNLKHRFFLPPNIDRYKNTKEYPLFIDIHGGGFLAGDPCMDDEYCALVAEKCSAIVVSINYRKAPGHQYPVAFEDGIAAVKAILSDPDLPIDRENIVIGGMSAGGTLAMSLAQSPELKGTFRAMVIWYPCVDMGLSVQPRLDFRPETGTPDALRQWIPLMQSAYVPPGQDLKDPGLSPFHAAVEDLPKKAFFVAAENDLLSYDTHIMAQKLAGQVVAETDNIQDADEDFTLWTAGNVSLYVARHQLHGFNVKPLSGEAEARRRHATDRVHERIIRWLREEVFDVIDKRTLEI